MVARPVRPRAERSGTTDRRAREYRAINRRWWDRSSVAYERINRASLERCQGEAWGVWRIPERELRLLDPVRGRTVLELGCGAGWWSLALARRGARVVGLDFSRARLDQARSNARSDPSVDWVRAVAERSPFRDGTFDSVLSDYGATTFADPVAWIPEVARLLRPGGSFVFAHASPWRTVSQDRVRDRMVRRLREPYFTLHEQRDPSGAEFQLPYGEWVRRFADSGLAVERLVELPAPARRGSTYVRHRDLAWARQWPMESIWKVRKRRR